MLPKSALWFGLNRPDALCPDDDLHFAYKNYYTHSGARFEEGKTGRSLSHGLSHAVFAAILAMTGLATARRRLDACYLDKARPGRLIEVGCGAGKRLASMRELGWTVEGQEMDPHAAAQARSDYGLPVHFGALETLALPENKFDVVIVYHVIEHVHNPIDLLQECHRILKPSGQLIVVTPNVDSWGHRHFDSCWRGLEPPRHLFIYSCRTLPHLASRAGFRHFGVWSTAANAQMYAEASLGLSLTNLHNLAGRLPWPIRLKILAYQWWALADNLIRHRSGEDCVLRATK